MNILDAITNLMKNPILEIKDVYVNDKNRANSMGDALEEYIKDLFAGTINEENEIKRYERYTEVFSYIGNDSNPPDLILKNGDAIEVKKIESLNSSIALNSSYPKSKLLSNSSLLSKHCKTCEYIEGTNEYWKEKDIIYSIGTIDKETRNLISLIFVYGEDYAASNETYENIKRRIKDGVSDIKGVEFTETKELGKANKVDPLGITYLRIRGMWGIENPLKVFKSIYERPRDNSFTFIAIVNEDKWNSFSNKETFTNTIAQYKNANISETKIRDANNPAKLKNVMMITYSV